MTGIIRIVKKITYLYLTLMIHLKPGNPMKPSMIPTILLLTGILLCSYSMPLSPESIERLRESGRLAQVVEHAEEARTRGVNAPGPNILESMHQIDRDDPVTLRVPVILVDFEDNEADQDEYPIEHYEELLFSLDELDPGSMREWYLENSYDEVNIIGEVVGWVRLDRTYAYYVDGQHGTGRYPRNSQGMTREAVIAANDDIDYSQFDNDNNGSVDAIFIVHAGPGAEAEGGDEDMIWSHAWALNDNRIRLDGVWINSYSTVPEDGQIGVFGHELGHALFGLIDVYDRDYSSEGLGDWSMMAGGSWGGGDGHCPAHFDAWNKVQAGFVDPVVIERNQRGFEIPPVEEEDAIYILWDGGDFENEYFIIENRQQIGFDESVPGSGLLIYHVDENVNDQNDNEWYPDHQDEGHYIVALEQADGDWDLEQGENRGDEGDPYPGSDDNETFDDDSTPHSRNYRNEETNVSVTNILLEDGVITCNMTIGEAVEPPDSLYYDDGEPSMLIIVENYWSKVTFTAEGDFELGTISFMPYNPGPNHDASCHIRVYSENDGHELNELLWETEIEELPTTEGEWDENWIRIVIPEDERITFEHRENFTIMYGPAPGGEYDPDNLEEGDGWWNLMDRATDVHRSFYFSGDDPAANHDNWEEIDYDLFIHAIAGGQDDDEPPEIHIEPEELVFELFEVGGGEWEAHEVITISNEGDGVLEFEIELDYLNNDVLEISYDPGEGEIEPDEELEIALILRPADDYDEGDYESELHILSNDPDNDDVVVHIFMSVVWFPHIDVVWPEDYGYPDLMDWNAAFDELLMNRDYDIQFTVTNVGNADLIVEDINIQGENFSVDPDNFDLEPEASRRVTVTFRSAEIGIHEALLEFTCNDPENQNFNFPLLAIIPNHAPEVRQEIDDQELEEDFDPFFVADLDNVFHDPDDHDLEFVAVSDNENLTVELDDFNQLRLEAAQNWYGEATVTVTADDGWDQEDQERIPHRGLRPVTSERRTLRATSDPGRDAVTEISFTVTVASVNDLPQIVEAPDVINANECDLITFVITAQDVDLEMQEEVLTFSLFDDDGVLDRDAQLVNNWDATASFTWQTNYNDAGVYVPIFMVEDLAEESDMVVIRLNIGNVNRVPELIEEIGDVEFDEDADERLITDLNDHFSDPDDDELQFRASDVEGLTVRIAGSDLYIRPEPDWNGEAELTVTADDLREGLASDTITVVVNSINDLPTAFGLQFPEDEDTVSTYPNILFTWERSFDEVEDSTIIYSLGLYFNNGGEIWRGNIADTSIEIPRDWLRNDPDIMRGLVWEVWAFDGTDSIRSDERFRLTVHPLSVQGGEELIPSELSLGPIYPNPFNEVVTIAFSLPAADKAVLTIYDPIGRLIVTLENTSLAAGRYRTTWDGFSQYGVKVSSGVYICRLITSRGVLMQRLVLLR